MDRVKNYKTFNMEDRKVPETINCVENEKATSLPAFPCSPVQAAEKLDSWTTLHLRRIKLYPVLFKGILFTVIPFWIWLSAYVIVGKEDLPGGSIFVLVILATGGRLLGYATASIGLPPMIGMLGLGLAIRNVPYIDFGKHLDPAWSSPLRQIALAVILTRAGLGLDLKILMKLKSIIFRFAIFPTTIEAIIVAVTSHFLLDFPWSWGFLLGFVLAPVSPAVVVPRLLELRDKGYGVEKGIPTFIIAAACLDNVLAISLFGVTLNFVFQSGNLALSIIQGPLQVLIGITLGLSSGFFLGILFDDTSNGQSITFVRFILTFGTGVISILGFSKLGYSGAGALGCLLSSFTASSIWKLRNVFPGIDPLCWGFYILWYIFEPLLFGVIGCQINITSLDLHVVYLGIAIIITGLCARLSVAYLMVTHAQFTMKEKLFSAISWIAKATVQAAIGPIALDMVTSNGNDPRDKILGERILTLAVLSILLTAAIGELGVIITGPRFLVKAQTEIAESRRSP